MHRRNVRPLKCLVSAALEQTNTSEYNSRKMQYLLALDQQRKGFVTTEITFVLYHSKIQRNVRPRGARGKNTHKSGAGFAAKVDEKRRVVEYD